MKFTCFIIAASLFASIALAEDLPRETNTLGMNLIQIPAGEFLRGVTDEQKLRAAHRHTMELGADLIDERPAHPVKLTRSFWIGAHEVTVKQFRAFVDETSYKTDAEKPVGVPALAGPDAAKEGRLKMGLPRGALVFNPKEKEKVERFLQDSKANWRNPGFEQRDDHPVTCVSHRDAVAFCEWLSKKENATYRLPTEAEWEYAARAGGETIYPGGDEPKTLYGYGNVGDAALEEKHPNIVKRHQPLHLEPGAGDGVVYTAPVGKFKPNAWGICDTSGNVWEWCSDKYYDRYYEELTKVARQKGSWAKPVPTVDPMGPETTPQHKFGDWRSMRGGCWYSGPMACRSASRAFGEAGDAFCYTGFRVVKELNK